MAEARILYNKKVMEGHYLMGLSTGPISVVPGQFVMVRVTKGLDPLLRRPFGVYNVLDRRGKTLRGAGIEILYRVVGRGTHILSTLEAGETLDVLLPLGNGFTDLGDPKRAIIVGGGMGIAPLRLLAEALPGAQLLFGCRTRKEAAIAGDLKKAGLRVHYATDDASLGYKGFVTGLLEERVTKESVVYSCGPMPMLKKISGIAERIGARSYVSLEGSMACGMGACLGCAVKSKAHDCEKENRAYAMVCANGPVFDSRDIDWEKV